MVIRYTDTIGSPPFSPNHYFPEVWRLSLCSCFFRMLQHLGPQFRVIWFVCDWAQNCDTSSCKPTFWAQSQRTPMMLLWFFSTVHIDFLTELKMNTLNSFSSGILPQMVWQYSGRSRVRVLIPTWQPTLLLWRKTTWGSREIGNWTHSCSGTEDMRHDFQQTQNKW